MIDAVTAELDGLARDLNDRCRLTGEFTLRSGKTSDEYFDKYLFESDPELLRRVVNGMVELLPPDTEVLAGLELGGIPITTVMSGITGLPALFVRKEAKAYGTRRQIEGGAVRGRQITLIEDVVTTGGAVRDAAMALRGDGGNVSTLVCAIDRSAEGDSVLPAIQISTRALVTKARLDAAAAANG